ncbi:MAG: hypothetical protein ACQEV6_06090 [Pseudomonadota bacterium]
MGDKKNMQTESGAREEQRRFAVSTNRSQARHRIRYVEAGGAAVDSQECVFCESAPDLRDYSERPG